MSVWMRDKLRKVLDLHPLVLVFFFTIADLLAGFLYWLQVRGVLHSRAFHLARDRGVAEFIQYAKFGVILFALVSWRRAKPSRLLGAWIFLFSVLLLDDAIGIHEEIGGWILARFSVEAPFGLRAKDLAEAVSFVMIEGVAFLYVALRYWLEPPATRAGAIWIAAALAPLVFFGIVLDVVPWPLTEQCGEMAAMSVLLACVHWLYKVHGRADARPELKA